MSENTTKMYRENLIEASEQLEALMVMGHDAIEELTRVTTDESLRLDTRKFRLVANAAIAALVAAEKALDMRDLRKRDGEFHERA